VIRNRGIFIVSTRIWEVAPEMSIASWRQNRNLKKKKSIPSEGIDKTGANQVKFANINST
jgi:hypothetical protein